MDAVADLGVIHFLLDTVANLGEGYGLLLPLDAVADLGGQSFSSLANAGGDFMERRGRAPLSMNTTADLEGQSLPSCRCSG